MTGPPISCLTALVRPPGPDDPSPGDWEGLLALAADRDMLGLVATEAPRRGWPMPAPVARMLELERVRGRRRLAWHALEAARALAALAAAGVAAVAIKGVALAHEVYDEPVERSLRDIDLLVAPEHVEPALAALGRCGWRPADDRVAALYRRHHFHVVLGGRGLPVLELHWALTRPDDPQRLPAAPLLDGAREIPRAAGALRVPHPDAHVLVACSSSLRDGFTDLKPVVDLDRLVRIGAPIRWPRVASLADGAGLEMPLRFLVELTGRICRTPLEPALAAVPALPAPIAHRLELSGAHELPLRPADERGPLLPHLVRSWLSCDRRRTMVNFLRRNAFERAQQRAAGIGATRRAAGLAGRLVQAAEMSAWRLVRRVAPRRL